MHRSTDHHHHNDAHERRHGHRQHGHKHHHRPNHGHRNEDHANEHKEYDESLYEYYGELEREVGLKLLGDLVKSLRKKGTVKLSDHQLSITDEADFSITHGETEDGTEKLTLEVEWYPDTDENSDADFDDDDEEEQSLPIIN